MSEVPLYRTLWGLTDSFEVDILGAWYKSVKFGVQKPCW